MFLLDQYITAYSNSCIDEVKDEIHKNVTLL